MFKAFQQLELYFLKYIRSNKINNLNLKAQSLLMAFRKYENYNTIYKENKVWYFE